MRPCVIFDADGTLCDVSEIRYLLRQPKGKKDFEKFHALSINCPPIPWVKQ
jgi:FMN phosphatase YigB (HAD superfamily)